MWTQIWTYRPQNLNIHVVFDGESDLLVKNIKLLHLDQVVQEKRTYKNTLFICSLFLVFYWFMGLRSNFNTREINSRENYRFFGHNSEPCWNFGTILRQHLPIITPDLPIPTRDLNSSVRPEFLNPKILYKIEKFHDY